MWIRPSDAVDVNKGTKVDNSGNNALNDASPVQLKRAAMSSLRASFREDQFILRQCPVCERMAD